MTWIKVLDATALPEGERKVVKLEDHDILLAHAQGEIYAMLNACPHMKLSLRKGEITEDETIVCPFHRSAFDLHTGAVKVWTPWPPMVGKLMGKVASERPLRVFATKVEDGSIWIEIEA